MKGRWCQRQPMVVVALIAAAAMVSLSQGDELHDSPETSIEIFRPSAPFHNTASSFRPVPRGGRHNDFSSSGFRSSSASAAATGPAFPPFHSNISPSTPFPPSFPSTPFFSSSHESSSYAIVPSSPFSSSPSFSSPSPSFHSTPSFSSPSIIQASGIEIVDGSAQESRESFGSAVSSALGFTSGLAPVHNTQGPPSRSYGPPARKPTPVNVYQPPPLSQTYGPPPKPTPSSAYGPPSPTPAYDSPPSHPTPSAAYQPPTPTRNYAPPPKPTPFSASGPPSPFTFDSRSRERFTVSEFPHSSSLEKGFGVPDNSFDTSVESFIGTAHTSRSFGGFSSPSIGFSGPRDSFSSHEAKVHPSSLRPSSSLSFLPFETSDSREHLGSFTKEFSPSISYSQPHVSVDSHEAVVHPSTLKSSSNFFLSSDIPDSREHSGSFTKGFAPSISFSQQHGSHDSHEARVHHSTLKPSLSFSFPSSEILDTREHFGSPTRGFSSPPSPHVIPAKAVHPSSFGLSPHGSGQSSSAEVFLRTRGEPRPVLSPHPTQAAFVKDARIPQTGFDVGHKSYYFNYDVNGPAEDHDSSASGQRHNKGPNFGHSERRDGKRTEGRYYVVLPDGRTQVVEYYADETGYHPTITYI